MKLNEALQSLDPNNAELWTDDGLPREDVVSGLVGRKVSRKDITQAAPTLSREGLIKAAQDAQAQADLAQQRKDAPLADPEEPEKDELELLDEQLAKLEAEVAERHAHLEAQRKELEALVRQRDQLLDKRAVRRTAAEEHRINVTEYLRTQQAQRDARAERLQGIAAADIKEVMSLLGRKSPIDAALSRRKSPADVRRRYGQSG